MARHVHVSMTFLDEADEVWVGLLDIMLADLFEGWNVIERDVWTTEAHDCNEGDE